MRILELIVGSVLAILLMIKLFKGRKYEYLVENLEEKEYPLKELYVIGYSWAYGRLLPLKGKQKEKLFGQASLLYEKQYAEYYATLKWAQMITFVHLLMCAGCLLAGMADSGLLLFIGIVGAVLMGYYSLIQMQMTLEERKMDCTIELPEVVSAMALLINAGMMLREAWERIANSKEGTIYTLMKNACSDMENGMSESEAIYRFSLLSNSQEIKKFASSLIQGLEKGNEDLGAFLSGQSTEMWTLKKQLMLQKGEAAASKLLIPTTLIFLGIIILVLAAAISTLI